MNKDINDTLYWLSQILAMNGEPVKKIEAVQDWYDTEADAEKIKDDLNSGKLTCSKYDPYYE